MTVIGAPPTSAPVTGPVCQTPPASSRTNVSVAPWFMNVTLAVPGSAEHWFRSPSADDCWPSIAGDLPCPHATSPSAAMTILTMARSLTPAIAAAAKIPSRKLGPT